MKPVKHWQDVINALVGVWVLLSPWALGFDENLPLVSNAVLAGAALVSGALGAIFIPKAWEEWVEGAIGLWLVASPWVMDFAMLRAPTWSAVLSGLVVMALALWTLMTDKDYNGWMHRRAAG